MKKKLINWFLGADGKRHPMTTHHRYWGIDHEREYTTDGYGVRSDVVVIEKVRHRMSFEQYQNWLKARS